MTDPGDHLDSERPPVAPIWGPPTGAPHGTAPPGELPGYPTGGGPGGPGGRRRWSRVALVVGAAALGFAAVVPATVLLRDGGNERGTAPAAPQVSTVPAPSTAATGTDQTGTGTPDPEQGVVDIDTRLAYGGGQAAGTGMIVTGDGQVLTNAHVIDGAASITVTIVSTGRSYDATVLGSDETQDVALLQMEDASALATVTLGDSSSIANGDSVVAVGNAGGTGGTPSVSEGTITGIDETITVGDPSSGEFERLSGLIETDAALEPGDSGGPMYDADGEVIGISTAADAGRGFPNGSRESYAVAIDLAEVIADRIRAGDGSDTIQIGIRGFLGVEVDPNTDGSFGADGAVLSGVLDGTPAADAGLQAGDVITGIDGQQVDSGDGLTAGLHGHQPGDEVTVDWTDAGGASRTATVTLTTGPA